MKIILIKNKKNQETFKFLNSNQLNMILYKFKNMYNELLKRTKLFK